MKKYLTAGLASILLAVGLVAAPSFAAPPDDAGSDRAAQVHINDEGSSGEQSQSQAQAQIKGPEHRKATQQRVERIKQEVQERRAEIKQRVCERRQEVFQQNIPRMASGATKVMGAFDTIYERVQGFYDNGQLTVENYEELKASVDAAQEEADVAVDVAADFRFELNCEEQDVASQLDGFRQAVTEAKDALKVYRGELVALISSMRAEAAVQNSQNTDAKPEEASNDQ